jgi:hypothetical protein
MRNRIALAAIFALCVSPAFARDDAPDDHDYAPACTAPAPPANIDANSHDVVEAFLADSDRYQRCLGRALGARQDLAFATHSNVPVVVVKQIDDRAAANQRQKEQVAKAYNAATTAAGTAKP